MNRISPPFLFLLIFPEAALALLGCGKMGYEGQEPPPDADTADAAELDDAAPELTCGQVCSCPRSGCHYTCNGDCAIDCPLGGCSVQCQPFATCLMWCNTGQFRCAGNTWCRQGCR